MKWFYLTTMAAVVLLGLSPLLLLPKGNDADLRGFVSDPLPDNAPPSAQPIRRPIVVSYDTYTAKVKTLDPAVASDLLSLRMIADVFEPLYGYHYLKRPAAAAPGQTAGTWTDCIVPLLAEAMPEVSPDGLTWTLRLKKGVKFHRNPCFGRGPDGTARTRELTADDFVLGFQRIADYHVTTKISLTFLEGRVVGLPEYRARTQAYAKDDFSRYEKESIEGIQAMDPHTLHIRLKAPFPQMIFVLAMPNYAPIPKEILPYYLAKHNSPEILHDFQAAVGTGPYYFDKFTDAGVIELRRNEDFRPDFYPSEGQGPDLAAGYAGDQAAGLLADAGRRVPFVDVQHLDYVSESNPAWMLFATKQTDLSDIPSDVYNLVITATRDLDPSMVRQGISLLKYARTGIYFFTLNQDDKVLGASKSLRQAMALAFNADDYIRVIHMGRGRRPANIVPSLPGFDGHDEAGPGPYAHFNLDEARAKMADAKKELVAAGVLRDEGEPIPPLTLDLGGRDETYSRIGEFAQQQWKAIGLGVKVELQDWPTLQDKMQKRQCRIYVSGWFADYPDAENFLQLFYGPNIKRGTNGSNYSNPQFDQLYRQAATMGPSPKRTKLYARMIGMISEDCPVILQSEPVAFLLFHRWMHNLKPHPLGFGFTKYRRVDLQERRDWGGRT